MLHKLRTWIWGIDRVALVVIYDACVLYPAPLRDLLIWTALTGTVQPRWSDKILDECFRNVQVNRPDLSSVRLNRTRRLMNQALPDALVTGYESLVDGLSLPDPDDRHVLAAAIRAGAQVIVTFNLRDFPQTKLTIYDVEAKHPDDFLLELIELWPVQVCDAVRRQQATLKNPPHTLEELLETLQAQRLPKSVARLRQLFAH